MHSILTLFREDFSKINDKYGPCLVLGVVAPHPHGQGSVLGLCQQACQDDGLLRVLDELVLMPALSLVHRELDGGGLGGCRRDRHQQGPTVSNLVLVGAVKCLKIETIGLTNWWDSSSA